MTALNLPQSQPLDAPSITSVAHVRPSKERQIQVYFARMMGIDYVFLCYDGTAPKDREIMRLTRQLCDELELIGDNTMFMLTELNANAIEDTFRQCQIRWVDGFPIELTRTLIKSAPQIDYLQTIQGHSTSYRNWLL